VVSGYIYEDVSETHVVRKGEVPGVIAQRYGVSLSDLREWNNIRGNQIYPGQKLVIRKTMKTPASASQPAMASAQEAKEKAPSSASVQPKNEPAKVANPSGATGDQYHVVRSGDTLWDIARLYPGVSANDIIRANVGVSSKSLKPGQKLKIPPQS
jgi:membrane-bound lytic murein transglycosylase D